MSDNHRAPEAERALLGTLLLDGGPSPETREVLHASDFHEIEHRKTYRAMLELADKGEAVTIDTLHYTLEDDQHVKDAGGFAFLTGLLAAGGGIAAQQVRFITDLARERWAETLAGRVAKAGKDPVELGKVLADAQAFLGKRWGTRQAGGDKEPWSGPELAALEIPEPDWLIEGWLPAGLTILAGAPSTGKSFLAMDISLAVATGGMALGSKAPQLTAVLYLGADSRFKTLQRRFIRICAGRAIEWPANWFLDERLFDLSDGKAVARLSAQIQEREIGLVVIDTLRRYTTVDENDSSQVAGVISILRELAQRTGVSILLVHHMRKPRDGQEGSRLEDVMGSVAWAAGVDCALGAAAIESPDGDKVRTLRMLKARDVEELPAKEYSIIDTESGGIIVGTADAREAATARGDARILAYVDEHPGCSVSELSEGIAGRKQTTVRAVQRLAGQGAIQQSRGAHNRTELRVVPAPAVPAVVPTPLRGVENGNNCREAPVAVPVVPEPSGTTGTTGLDRGREARDWTDI
jgi:hypothetical protein